MPYDRNINYQITENESEKINISNKNNVDNSNNMDEKNFSAIELQLLVKYRKMTKVELIEELRKNQI